MKSEIIKFKCLKLPQDNPNFLSEDNSFIRVLNFYDISLKKIVIPKFSQPISTYIYVIITILHNSLFTHLVG